MLWHFLHGATLEGGTDEGQYDDEAVGSEEETSHGSLFQPTTRPTRSR